MEDSRSALEQLIRDRGEDYASLSRLLGRNAAYIQQFIRRGVPKKLDEADRRTLAKYFGVDEAVLGGPPRPDVGALGLIVVPRHAVAASAGAGSLPDDERSIGRLGFDPRLLKELTNNPALLSAIRVAGDSMSPTLSDGDEILIDRGDAATMLRDGIYVLRLDDALNVKRIARHPATRTITVSSDNSAYPSWPDIDPRRVDIIGRVIWIGRRVR